MKRKIKPFYRRSFTPRFKRPTIIDILFEAVEEITSNKLFDVFLSGYSESYSKARFYALNPTTPKLKTKEERERDFYRRLRHNFYSQLSYLQKKKFVVKIKGENKTVYRLTKTGERIFENIKKKLGIVPKRRYLLEKEDKMKVIIFDIPEKEKFKREWLRSQLNLLGFTMLQKSVWIGKNKLPIEFMEDLDAINLMRYIHIFHVSAEDQGTIK